ncbi:MAG: xanthine dehydrogenase family protein subunit M [Candidatus Cryosericum sp.]
MGRITEYYRATSLEDAFTEAKQLGTAAAYVGGGVELILRRNPEVTTLIDLSRCGLDYIVPTGEGIEIGSQTTLATINRSADIRKYAGGSLAWWAGRIAQNNLRDMITVGGAIGRNQPWNDVVPHLVALGAQVRLFDGADHVMPLAGYIEAKQPGVIIKGVLLPAENAGSSGFLWRFTRTQQDIATLHFSALIGSEGGVVSSANLVFAGRPGHAARYPALSEGLVGKSLSHETFARVAEMALELVEVGTDLRATGEFRRELVRAAIVNLEEHMTGVSQ